MINFPTVKQRPDVREIWVKACNRMDPKNPHKFLEPSPSHILCSDHFVDGSPTVENPVPSIFPLVPVSKRINPDREEAAQKRKQRKIDREQRIIAQQTVENTPAIQPDAASEENGITNGTSVVLLKFLLFVFLSLIRNLKRQIS